MTKGQDAEGQDAGGWDAGGWDAGGWDDGSWEAGKPAQGGLATISRDSGEPLVLLHGFTQNALCWGGLARALDAEGRRLLAVDLPGHGGSGKIRADLSETAGLVADACGPADYIGYSQGGRVLLHLALSRPDVVRRAVLIGATAGIEDVHERADRVRADEVLARELDDAGEDRAALEAFLRRWLAGPLFSHLSAEAACFEQRMRNEAAGLASSLRLCGTGNQAPLWNRLEELTMPVLVLAGEDDERFALLAQRLGRSIGDNAIVGLVPGAGHSCHLEKPVETAAIIDRFLSREGAPEASNHDP